jgi:hypothetical protein
MKTKTRPLLLYFSTVTFGTIILTTLLIFVCTIFHFDHKSAICVYLYGIGGYIIKTLIFSLTYLLLYKESYLTSKPLSTTIAWMPFILFFMWYLVLIVFQIDALYFDLSFGYIARFPHFYAQLLAVLIVSMTIAIRLNRRHKVIAIDQTGDQF